MVKIVNMGIHWTGDSWWCLALEQLPVHDQIKHWNQSVFQPFVSPITWSIHISEKAQGLEEDGREKMWKQKKDSKVLTSCNRETKHH